MRAETQPLSRRLVWLAAMVMTPWGDSDSLRERRLRPGPGRERSEVEQNQRERLFGAMIALVAEKGYEATTLNDLAELSGVSSRSFYQLFDSKRAIFAATMRGVIELSVAAGARGNYDPQLAQASWEERGRVGAQGFAATVVAQPAAARVMLIEAFGAGTEMLQSLEGAIAGFEALAREIVAESPERVRLVGTYTAVIEEIVRRRLVAAEESELPRVMEGLWDLIEGYEGPPGALRLVGRAPAVGSEGLEAHDSAERVIRALALEVAERGYVETTVAAVLARGKMSATTFYDSFGGKEEAMAGAIDSAAALMAAAMATAVRRAPDWAASVRAAIGALLSFLTSRPALAQLVLQEAYVAGPFALRRRVGTLAPLEALLAEGRELNPESPTIGIELIEAVFFGLGRRAMRDGGPGALSDLAPLCAYLALAPYVGAEQALVVANGDGGRRARGGRQTAV